MKENLYPWIKQITLKQLRGLHAVVGAGSISGAAKTLHLTPPAVSLQIRDLENAAGIPLLERSETGLIPTLGGEAMYTLADNMFSALYEFAETLDEINGVYHGVVSVGVVSTARYFAPTVLAEFNKLYPEVKLQLSVGNRESIMSKLGNLELDFAITGLPPDNFKVKSEYIGKNPQVIIAPPDHEYSESTRIPLKSLKDQVFLLREPGSGTRSVVDKLFEKSSFIPASEMEFGSNETIKQAVMAGMGIALISAHTVAAELKEKRLVALDVKGLPISRKWFVVKNQKKRFLPSAQTLWEFIVRSGKSYFPVP